MKQIIFNVSLFLTLFIGLLEPANINAQESELTIIGNTKSVPSEMDMNQLKAVLKGERMRWDDGSKIVVALMKTSTPVGTNTCNRIFNMTSNQLNKYFLAMVFQGKINRPNLFNSENELETFVAQTPGAIGVLQNANDTQLITVMVDGKKQI